MNFRWWQGRRVLITGHTGFKGAWLAFWLGRLGADVRGLALPPADTDGAYRGVGLDIPSHFVDIGDQTAVEMAVVRSAPSVVFHLAAQALVGRGLEDPLETYRTNVLGTANVLGAVARAEVPVTVVVTSDKVYAEADDKTARTEDDALGGADPYSASKACAELVTRAWATSSGLAVASARAGNVIGGGDVAPDRLLPDLRRSWKAGRPVTLRRPRSVRPWQFVLDPLYGYLLLAHRLATSPGGCPTAVNFGPGDDAMVPASEVVDVALAQLGGGRWVEDSTPRFEEMNELRLDSTLAQTTLGWQPALALDEAVAWTTEWWLAEVSEQSLRDLCDRQIATYESRVS